VKIEILKSEIRSQLAMVIESNQPIVMSETSEGPSVQKVCRTSEKLVWRNTSFEDARTWWSKLGVIDIGFRF